MGLSRASLTVSEDAAVLTIDDRGDERGEFLKDSGLGGVGAKDALKLVATLDHSVGGLVGVGRLSHALDRNERLVDLDAEWELTVAEQRHRDRDDSGLGHLDFLWSLGTDSAKDTEVATQCLHFIKVHLSLLGLRLVQTDEGRLLATRFLDGIEGLSDVRAHSLGDVDELMELSLNLGRAALERVDLSFESLDDSLRRGELGVGEGEVLGELLVLETGLSEVAGESVDGLF